MGVIVMHAGSLSSVTEVGEMHKLAHMVELIRISDPVLLQVLSDALESRGIIFRIDNAGMNALMPLPTVMDARVLVAEQDKIAAEQVVRDLELDL